MADAPTRSLRAAVHPQARMQEMLRKPPEDGSPPDEEKEIMKERNSEGIFIVSELPIKKMAELPSEEKSEEDNSETNKELINTRTKQPKHTGPKPASGKPSPKLSLKDTVLEDSQSGERISKTRLNVDIDEDLHFWLKEHALRNRRKLNDLIPRILQAYRDEVEGESL